MKTTNFHSSVPTFHTVESFYHSSLLPISSLTSISHLSLSLYFPAVSRSFHQCFLSNQTNDMYLSKSFLKRTTSRNFCFSKSLRERKTLEPSTDDVKNDGSGGGDVTTRSDGADQGGSWATMLPEILGEIIKRVETSEDRWPVRQNVVACACVCKRWRDITREIVKSPVRSGKITFPSCLKQVLEIFFVLDFFSFF